MSSLLVIIIIIIRPLLANPVAYIYSYYIKTKSRLSALFCHAHNFAVSRHIDSGLARNVNHVFWHQPVCFKKFLTAAVCRPRRFEQRSVEDFCRKLHLHTCKSQPAAQTGLVPSIFINCVHSCVHSSVDIAIAW